MTDDLNDSLDGLFGGPAGETVRTPKGPPATFVPAIERVFTESCAKCGGSGNWRPGYPCFGCKGSGKLQFKTSPDQRAKARGYSDKKRVEKLKSQQVWREEHKAEVMWLTATAERQIERAHKGQKVWDFPVKLNEGLAQYGTLTDGQLEAVRKCMARDAERTAQRAVEAQAQAAAAPAVSVEKLELAFTKAKDNAAKRGAQVSFLKLRLDTFVFSPGSAGSQWDGMIFVKEGDVKLGRIESGRFIRKFSCDDATEARILAAAQDPLASAIAYGRLHSECSVCGAKLTNGVSIDRGIGPICAEKYGWV